MKRLLRSAQTFLPFIRPLKFDGYNLLTRTLGWRMDIEFRLLEKLRPVGLVLDIGGNWGQSIYAFKRTARPARIVSFEPNRVLCDRLGSKFARDASVEIENYALAEQDGAFDLYIPRYRGFIYDGLASLDEQQARNWLNPRRVAGFDPALLRIDTQKVAVRRLDDFGLSPDVVKMDVEGGEEAVVRGGLETYRRTRPASIVESPSDSLVDLFAEFDLKPYGYDGRRLLDRWQGRRNVIFLNDDHRSRMGV